MLKKLKALWNSLSPFTRAAFMRALKTMAQTALALLLTNDRVSGVDWGNIVDVAAMSGLLSILTSVSAGVPESPLQLQEGSGSTEQPLHVQEGGGPDEHY